MSRKRKRRAAPQDDKDASRQLPEPVDVVDGIPDRRPGAPLWRYVLIGVVFLAWLSFLIYCAAAGRP
jgi:hypothetical protein